MNLTTPKCYPSLLQMLTSDWSTAATALSCKQLSKTLGAVRLVLFRRELLSSQQLRAVRARETIAMPRSVLVSYSTLVDHLCTGKPTIITDAPQTKAKETCEKKGKRATGEII